MRRRGGGESGCIDDRIDCIQILNLEVMGKKIVYYELAVISFCTHVTANGLYCIHVCSPSDRPDVLFWLIRRYGLWMFERAKLKYYRYI